MFPITVYDKDTATLRPIWDAAIKAGLVMGIEWSSLTLIEDAPRYVKFATFFISISALAVWQHRPWLYRRWKWWFPILMWPLVLAFIGVWTYAYLEFTPVTPVVANPTGATAPSKPPPRSRQAIKELLDESDALLKVIVGPGSAIEDDWRSSLPTKNPEEVCFIRNAGALGDEIKSIIAKLFDANSAIVAILDQNRIDQAVLAPLLGGDPGSNPPGFINAAAALEDYQKGVEQLATAKTCNDVIQSNQGPHLFSNMEQAFRFFQTWMTDSRNRLRVFQDSLHKEARDAP